MTVDARTKVERLRAGQRPRVLDLFSGCGGLFLGFHRAGCVSVGGVELDPLASLSYAANFHAEAADSLFAHHAAPKDITVIQPTDLRASLGWESLSDAVDIIVGGPPCPAFARVGRAKLREIDRHPEAFKQDPRAQLYLPYIHYVQALRPIAVVMENVPDILNFGGHNLGEEICDLLEDLGYECAYTLLNAANYGVPQMRERFFLIGIHRDCGSTVHFPEPTRFVDFPRGYEGSRQVALKHLGKENGRQNGLAFRERYLPTPEAQNTEPPVTVEEALADLPALTAHLNGGQKRGARRFRDSIEYVSDSSSSVYAKSMRTWPGFEGDANLYDHVTRALSKRDYRLFRLMGPGDEYPEAHALAVRLFDDYAESTGLDPSSPDYAALRAGYVPPYDAGKFPNKWRKMEPDQPSRTLMAHLGKDGYSHIHYDSLQARVISVREAGRLQSIPDGFVFAGTMNPAFRQIGNSVPPLMSLALAEALLDSLGVSRSKGTAGGTGGLEDRRRLAQQPLSGGTG